MRNPHQHGETPIEDLRNALSMLEGLCLYPPRSRGQVDFETVCDEIRAVQDRIKHAIKGWRTNPQLAIENPLLRARSHVRGTQWPRAMGEAVYEIKYRHADDHKNYVHEFEHPEHVRMTAQSPIRVMLSSSRPIVGMFD